MIPYFDIFPRELLWGALARLSIRLGFRARKTFQYKVLGSRNIQAVSDLPANLLTLEKMLPAPSHQAGQLIDSHTLYPLYACFLGQKRAEKLRHLMMGNGGPRIHSSVGVSASAVKQPIMFRICPLCSKEQQNMRRTTWWVRDHQIAGLQVCLRHGIDLLETCVARRHRRARQAFSPVPTCDEEHTTEANSEQINVARLASQILEERPLFDPQQLVALYRNALATRGYVTGHGSIRWKLASDFAAHYGEQYLSSIHSLVSTRKPGWLASLLQRPHRAQAPIRHLLLMAFLRLRPADYFMAHTVVVPTKNLRPTSRKVEWTTEQDIALECYWRDKNMSLRQIGRLIKVDPMTIKRRALALGLVFPREAKRPTVVMPPPRGTRPVSNIVNRREHWLRTRKNHPSYSRKQLRRLAPATFAWLYRNDRDWLLDHQPPVSRIRGRPGRRVNWCDRDKRLSLRAKDLIQEMIETDFEGRVSATEVSRRLYSAATIRKNAKKLPRTVAILTAQSETRTNYALRRIKSKAGRIRLRPDLLRQRVITNALRKASL